ncbi:MAG: ester cyclase [Anaerolineales bacterium]|nr:ester cyclase [Anaerolineales bacterium]
MFANKLKSYAREFIEQAFNQRNEKALDGYFSQDLVDHALPPMLPPGFQGRKMFYGAFLAAFPDLHVHIENLVEENDRVVTHWSAHGTHQGELMGIPPTGKTVQVSGIAIDRFENGKSVEHWEVFDQMGLMQQLGVIPAAGSA